MSLTPLVLWSSLVGSLWPAQRLYSDNVPYFTPAANLKARVKPRVLFGDAGVDLLLVDSTNAEVPGFVPSERSDREIRDLNRRWMRIKAQR